MEINQPVFMLKMTGNTKEKVKLDKHTAFASFEATLKQTVVFVVTVKLNEAQAKKTGRSLKEHFSQYGTVVSLQYYSNGADIIRMHNEN